LLDSFKTPAFEKSQNNYYDESTTV